VFARGLRNARKRKSKPAVSFAKEAPKREGSEPGEPDKRLAEALAAAGGRPTRFLRVMSSSPGNVHPVLDAVCRAGRPAYAMRRLLRFYWLKATRFAPRPHIGLGDRSRQITRTEKRTWPLTRGFIIGRAAVDSQNCAPRRCCSSTPIIHVRERSSRSWASVPC
jgi:hypothetical protein